MVNLERNVNNNFTQLPRARAKKSVVYNNPFSHNSFVEFASIQSVVRLLESYSMSALTGKVGLVVALRNDSARPEVSLTRLILLFLESPQTKKVKSPPDPFCPPRADIRH